MTQNNKILRLRLRMTKFFIILKYVSLPGMAKTCFRTVKDALSYNKNDTIRKGVFACVGGTAESGKVELHLKSYIVEVDGEATRGCFKIILDILTCIVYNSLCNRIRTFSSAGRAPA